MTFPISSEVVANQDATYEQYNNLRTDVLAHRWSLYQAFTGARYMPQTLKDGATWTMTSDTGSVVSSANMYNGDLSTYGYCVYQADYLNIKIDWGSTKKLNQIEINFGTNPDVRFDQVWIYGSATGAFAGEETTIINGESGGAAFENWQIDFTAAEYRYWKIRLYGVEAATSGLIYDINFKYFTDPPAISGGYMSTPEKLAATWNFSSDTGTVTDSSNMYDGDTGTFGYVLNQDDYLNIKIDFGGDVVLDQIDINHGTTVSDRFDQVWIYGSDTGAFAGEETTIINGESGGDGYENWQIDFDAAQFRYWKIRLYGVGTSNYGRVYELNFYYGAVLVVQGVPWGCEVQLWDGNGLIEAEVSESIVKPGVVEFTTTLLANIDTVKVTKPDGSDWLEFTGLSFSTGDLYSLTKGE